MRDFENYVRLEGPGLIRRKVNDICREFEEDISRAMRNLVPGVLVCTIRELFDSYRRSNSDALAQGVHPGTPGSWKDGNQGSFGLSLECLQSVNDQMIFGIEAQSPIFDLESLGYDERDFDRIVAC